MNTNQTNPTMEASTQQVQRELESKSLFVAVTSVLTSNGFLSLLLFLLLALGSGCVYASSSGAYEFFKSLPVRLQFAYVTWAGLFAVGFAATMREVRKDWLERWAARIVGIVGVGILVAFSYHMTMQVDQLQHQLASKGAHSGLSIATNRKAETISGRVPETITRNPVRVHTSNGIEFIFVDVGGRLDGGPVQGAGYSNDSMGHRLRCNGGTSCSRTTANVATWRGPSSRAGTVSAGSP